jgi:hypothetical protein
MIPFLCPALMPLALAADISATWEKLPYANDEARRLTRICVVAYHALMDNSRTLECQVEYRTDKVRFDDKGSLKSEPPESFKGWLRHSGSRDAYLLRRAKDDRWHFGALHTPEFSTPIHNYGNPELVALLYEPKPKTVVDHLQNDRVEYRKILPDNWCPEYFRLIEELVPKGEYDVVKIDAGAGPDGDIRWQLMIGANRYELKFARRHGYAPVRAMVFYDEHRVQESEMAWTEAGQPPTTVLRHAKSTMFVGAVGKGTPSLEYEFSLKDFKANEPIDERSFTIEGFGLPNMSIVKDVRTTPPGKDMVLIDGRLRPREAVQRESLPPEVRERMDLTEAKRKAAEAAEAARKRKR